MQFGNAAKLMVVILAASLPFGTAVANITLGLLLLFWLMSGRFGEKYNRVHDNPVALWALGLYSLFLLGLVYSSAGMEDGLDILREYSKLLYIPLLISIIDEPKWRTYAIRAFLIGMLVILAMSYGKYFGILPPGPEREEYTVFKGRIAHGVLVAFAAYLWVHYSVASSRWRWVLSGLALIAIHNMLFVNGSRTGYVVFCALTFLLVIQYFKWRGLLAAFILLPVIAIGLFHTSERFQSELLEAQENIARYIEGDSKTAVGYRLEFYETTLAIVRERPLFGYGTGSFKAEYAKRADQLGNEATANPHNEYLFIMTQLGLAGLLLLLAMGFRQWRLGNSLVREDRLVVQGIIAAIGTGCLFNTFLVDATEGKLYVVMLGIAFSGLSRKGVADSVQVLGNTSVRPDNL
jgi:O-antigen ligase